MAEFKRRSRGDHEVGVEGQTRCVVGGVAKYAMTMLSGGRRRQALHFCVVAIIGAKRPRANGPRPPY